MKAHFSRHHLWVRTQIGVMYLKNTRKHSLLFSERKGYAWGVRVFNWYLGFNREK